MKEARKNHVLFYPSEIQTQQGNSGSPIFTGNAIVGVHTGGKYPTKPNHGTFFGDIKGLKEIFGESEYNQYMSTIKPYKTSR